MEHQFNISSSVSSLGLVSLCYDVCPCDSLCRSLISGTIRCLWPVLMSRSRSHDTGCSPLYGAAKHRLGTRDRCRGDEIIVTLIVNKNFCFVVVVPGRTGSGHLLPTQYEAGTFVYNDIDMLSSTLWLLHVL